MDDRVLLHEESRDESEVTRAMRMAGERKTEPSETSPTPPREHTVTPSHPHKDHALRVDRSRQWRVETDKKLGMLAHKMVAVLVTGDGWRGRRGVVLWAHCLLGNCHRSLVTMAPILLEALLSLSHDGYQQVSMAATISLDMFSAQHADEVGSELAAVLEERLYALASSLPRLMRQHDDVQKASTLQLLAGYLQLLGPHTLTLTHSHAHLSRITQALVQTLELDASDSHIVEEVPTPHESADKLNESLHPQGPGENGAISSGPRGPTGDSAWWTLSLHYKHFRLPQVETLIQHCCQLLGFLGSLPTLLDHLLDMYRTSTHQRSELLVIIGHALLGAAGRGCVQGKRKPPHAVCGEEMCELVEGVLEEVTGEGWRGRGGGGGGEEGGESTPASATLLQCLQLQVVDVCVRLLRASFLPHLQTQAYLLLARAGSPLPEVSSLALSTLTTVASCTEESSLAQLITSSADYLVNCVALTLRGHTHKQEALQVLQAVLEHGAREVLPLMRDSIEELLLCLDLQLLDNEGVWSVLRSLAAAVHRWSSELMEGKSGSDGSGCHGEVECGGREEVECGDVKSYFLEYCHNKHSEQEEEGEGEQEGLGDTQEGVVAPQTLSPADQAAVDVLQHCPHFLPSHSPPLSHHNPTSSLTPSPSLPPSVPLRVLDCLSHCLHALRHNQQALLPEVHKVWPSFVLRLSDSSPPVALRAVEVLWDMCEVCGDFVRRRVVKEVWPVIAQSLTRLAAGSRGADGRYRFSASCRLQLKMLESVGILPGKLQVGAADLEVLIHSCLPYLSCNQPSSLLETCKASLTALTRLDPDTMWLLLHQLVPMETKHPPHPSLPPYKFARLADGDEFTEAGSHLLQLTLSHSL